MSSVPFTDLDAKYGLPEGLLASVWKQESGCGANMVSRAGARGHFQFMPKTRPEIVSELGLDPWSSDPRVAAECAGYYLHKLAKQQHGDLEKALASYNAGAGNVDKAERRGGDDWLSKLKGETQNYVPQILGRIGLADRMDFTNRYEKGWVTDDAELEKERGLRRGILGDWFGMSAEEIRKMSDTDLLGMSFVGLIASFVKAMFEVAPAAEKVPFHSTEITPPLDTPKASVNKHSTRTHA